MKNLPEVRWFVVVGLVMLVGTVSAQSPVQPATPTGLVFDHGALTAAPIGPYGASSNRLRKWDVNRMDSTVGSDTDRLGGSPPSPSGSDSILNGLLIGTAIGAASGFLLSQAVCSGPCDDYGAQIVTLVGAGVGAGVGAAIDVVHSPSRQFSVTHPRSKRALSLSSLFGRRRVVRATIAF